MVRCLYLNYVGYEVVILNVEQNENSCATA